MTDEPRSPVVSRAVSITVAVFVAAAAGVFVISQQAAPPADPSNPSQPAGIQPMASSPRDVAGAALVHRLELAVRSGDRAGFMALGRTGNRPGGSRLRVVFDNLRQLHVTDFTARYLGDGAGRVPGRDEWVAHVDMSWRLRGFDAPPVSQQSSMTFTTRNGRTYLERIGLPRDNRWPLWALGVLTVRRHGGVVAVAVGAERTGPTLRAAERAVADVRTVIGWFDGPLLVVAPETARQFDRLVGVSAGSYANIAAVTTTADGSLKPRSLTTIDLNHTAFGRLGPVGAQVVLAHEATHAATRSVTTSLPAWLEEGFADYVALRATRLSPELVARGLLSQVREHGAPAQLPAPGAFLVGAPDVGRTYEAAWLACQMIAGKYGQRALVRLYEQAGRVGAGPALHRVLGIGPAALTRSWQAYLERLARD